MIRHRETTSGSPTALLARAVACVLLLASAGVVGAQATDGAATASADVVIGVDAIPALATFGVQFGFPAYRTAGVAIGLQARFVALALRAGGGPGGLAMGAQARGYLPLPLPVPTYLGVGVDAYAGRFAPNATFGFHLPFGERWRLDAEAGVAWTPLLDETRLTPYFGVGVSYAVPVSLTPAETSAGAAFGTSGPAGTRCVVGPPDAAAIDAAVAATVRRFVADGVATYGSVYREFRYRTTVRSVMIDGVRATVVVAYEGSVVEILTRREVRAAGDAEVDFRWDGCAWIRTGLRY